MVLSDNILDLGIDPAELIVFKSLLDQISVSSTTTPYTDATMSRKPCDHVRRPMNPFMVRVNSLFVSLVLVLVLVFTAAVLLCYLDFSRCVVTVVLLVLGLLCCMQQ